MFCENGKVTGSLVGLERETCFRVCLYDYGDTSQGSRLCDSFKVLTTACSDHNGVLEVKTSLKTPIWDGGGSSLLGGGVSIQKLGSQQECAWGVIGLSTGSVMEKE